MPAQPEPLILEFRVDDKGRIEVQKFDKAVDKTGKTLDKTSRRVGRFRRGLSGFGSLVARAGRGVRGFTRSLTSLRTAAAAALLALGVNGLLGAFSEYDKAIREVATLTNLTELEIRGLDRTTRQLSNQYGQLPVNTARAFYQTVSAGFTDTAQSTELLIQANRLAIAGVTDVDTAIEALIATLKPYSQDARDAARVSDLLFATVRSGITTIPELSSSLSQVTGAASAAGVSQRELLGIIASVTAASKASAGDVATQVTSILKSASIVGDRVKKLNEDLGLNIRFSPSEIRNRGLVATLVGLREELDKISDLDTRAAALSDLIPRIEGQRGFQFITGPALETFRQFTSQELEGIVEDAIKIVERSASFRLGRLKAVISSLSIELGGLIFSIFGEDIDNATETLNKLSQFVEANRDDVQAILRSVFETTKIVLATIVRTAIFIGNVVSGIIQDITQLGTALAIDFGSVLSADFDFDLFRAVIADLRSQTDSIIGQVFNVIASIGNFLKELAIVPFRVVGELASFFFEEFKNQFRRLANFAIGLILEISATPQIGKIISEELRQELLAVNSDLSREIRQQRDESFLGAITKGFEPLEAAAIDTGKSVTGVFRAIKESGDRDLKSGLFAAFEGLISKWDEFKVSVAESPDFSETQKAAEALAATIQQVQNPAGGEPLANLVNPGFATPDFNIGGGAGSALQGATFGLIGTIEQEADRLAQFREFYKGHVDELALIDEANQNQRLAIWQEGFAGILGTLDSFQDDSIKNSKEFAALYKATAIGQAIASTMLAANQVMVLATAQPGQNPLLSVAQAQLLAGVIVASGLARVATIAATPTFHSGGEVGMAGPVPGSLKHNEVLATLERGEHVLSRDDVSSINNSQGVTPSGGGQEVTRVGILDTRELADAIENDPDVSNAIETVLRRNQ